MTVPLFHAAGGVLVRKGRTPVVAPPAPPTTFSRPTGPGYYAIEDLGVGMDFNAAAAKVKTLATGVDSTGRTHRTLTLPAMTISANGFAKSENYCGFLLPDGVSVVGSGPTQTVFQVTPDTITQAQVDDWYPPIDSYPGTITLTALIAANGTNVELAQFGLRGTQQRLGGTKTPGSGFDTYHYNGIKVPRSTKPTIRDVKVWGIPGYRNSPPGETFGISTYLGSGARFYRVEVDGRNDSGVRVGAAGIGTNTTSGVYFEDCSSHDNAVSHGFAFWETNNGELVRCSATNNGSASGADLGGVTGAGFNMERSRNIVHRSPRMGGNTLCEMRFYARNDGDAYDGDTTGHQVLDAVLTDGGPFDIRIDNAQVTLPTLTRCPPPVYDVN